MSRQRPIVLAAALAALAACAGPGQRGAAAAPVAAAQAAPRPDRSKVPENGPPPALKVPDQIKFRLSNGLAVRLVEYRRLPIVALNLVVDAGSARDPEQLPGLASLTASMLTEGTTTRTATQISDDVGFLGASIGAGAGVDSASLSGGTLSKHLPRFLEIFSDVAMNPAFPKADFARVQDERLVALLQQRDQPGAIASKAFQPVFWGAGNPYGHYSLGTEESVKALTPAELAAFHARYWTPASAELVVVGDVSEAELKPLLERTLGAWKGEAAPAPLPPSPGAAPHRTVVLEKADAPQSYLLIGMPGLRRTADDYVAGTVAFQVLGGGMASRLFRHLREEKGYTYGVYAHGDARKLAGVSFIVGSVKSDVTGPALKDILGELARLRQEPVAPEELAVAKDALILGLPADFATAGATAGRIADLVVNGLPDDYWNRYAERVRQVTAADVQGFAERYLDPGKLTIVMVASPQIAKAQLADLPLGPVEVRAAPPPLGAAKPAATSSATPAPAPPSKAKVAKPARGKAARAAKGGKGATAPTARQ